jgi:hypothetical protein
MDENIVRTEGKKYRIRCVQEQQNGTESNGKEWKYN